MVLPNTGHTPEFRHMKGADVEKGALLGTGAFGAVYKARHREYGEVALKVVSTDAVIDKDDEKELTQEAYSLARVPNQYVTLLYGVILEPGNYSLVMEFVEHGSLDKFMKKHTSDRTAGMEQERKVPTVIAQPSSPDGTMEATRQLANLQFGRTTPETLETDAVTEQPSQEASSASNSTHMSATGSKQEEPSSQGAAATTGVTAVSESQYHTDGRALRARGKTADDKAKCSPSAAAPPTVPDHAASRITVPTQDSMSPPHDDERVKKGKVIGPPSGDGDNESFPTRNRVGMPAETTAYQDTNEPGLPPGSDGSTTVISMQGQMDGVQIGDKNVMYVNSGGRGQVRGTGGYRRVPPRRVVAGKPITTDTRVITKEDITVISENLGSTWRKLGRHLGFTEGKLDAFDSDYAIDGLQEKIYQMLVAWRRMGSDDATAAKLAEALCSIGKADVAVYLCSGAMYSSDPLKVPAFLAEDKVLVKPKPVIYM
uniref:Death domain-containing protein n=1 Tax=Branchiostoma floridae TaxID=7739 RepID=C3XTV5_BRAFL|eukprot:XP_002612320.1 hypothetical protein BRAFLDRAFT_80064 [Branchiostoma floridae]